jgi:putative tricarboxylic transport membrane protein
VLQAFGLASWEQAATALVGGTALGFLFGLMPGIGGRVGIILAMPLAAAFEPYSAAIFLFALHSIIHTSSSIPAIALGMPLSGADAATVLDGYPLAKMGRAGEALGASLSASAIGGIIGALVFVAAIPIARPLVASFGPPELLLLALFGITMVTSLSPEGLAQGLVVTAIGVLLAMIGLDPRTGEPRFTFGLIELWEGLSIPALVCGLFVIPEMLSTKRHIDEAATNRAIATRMRDVYRGMFVTLRHKAVLLRSTLYGLIAGVTPAVGSTIGVLMAYAYAARTTKSDIPFGKGAIAGVIAPEAANNSKEGGAMIPTLFFAIPGSSSMAVMMAGLGLVGVAVGPNMLGKDVGLSYALAAAVIFANLLAIPAFFMVVPFIVRLSAIKRDAVTPIAITLSLAAALISEPKLVTVAEVFLATLLGVGLKHANWPRAPLILGFVVAEMAERSYFRTAELWGWTAFERPQFIVLLLAMVAWIVYSLRHRPPSSLAGPRATSLALCAVLAACFVTIIAWCLGLPASLSTVPLAASLVGLAFCGLIAWNAMVGSEPAPGDETIHHVGTAVLLLLATPIVGLPVATFGFAAVLLWRAGISLRATVLSALVLCAVQLTILGMVFDVLVERDIIGRIAWAALGY